MAASNCMHRLTSASLVVSAVDNEKRLRSAKAEASDPAAVAMFSSAVTSLPPLQSASAQVSSATTAAVRALSRRRSPLLGLGSASRKKLDLGPPLQDVGFVGPAVVAAPLPVAAEQSVAAAKDLRCRGTGPDTLCLYCRHAAHCVRKACQVQVRDEGSESSKIFDIPNTCRSSVLQGCSNRKVLLWDTE